MLDDESNSNSTSQRGDESDALTSSLNGTLRTRQEHSKDSPKGEFTSESNLGLNSLSQASNKTMSPRFRPSSERIKDYPLAGMLEADSDDDASEA